MRKEVFILVLGLSPPLNVQNYFDDRYPTRGKCFRSFLLTRASMICWFIWLTRNEVIFDKCRPNALMHVLFKGTHWLQSWAQLQLSEEQNKMILQACRQLGNVYVFFRVRPCLVPPSKIYSISHRMFGHMHRVLNID